MIKRVNTIQLARKYRDAFCKQSGATLPLRYIYHSKSYLLLDKKKNAIGGFIIAPSHLSRVEEELPQDYYGERARCELKYFSPFSELNGYFILIKSKGWILVSFWFMLVLLSRSKYFVYAYENTNKHLKKYYSVAKPIVIYDGLVNNLEGMVGEHHERIELISKWGFLKLYSNRLLKRIRMKLWN